MDNGSAPYGHVDTSIEERFVTHSDGAQCVITTEGQYLKAGGGLRARCELSHYQLPRHSAEAQSPAMSPDTITAETESILQEAQSAIYGDREADYGSPRDNWTRTAILWTGLLQHKLADGEYITPEDGLRCMVAVKLARDVNSPKRDNRVDGAGYLALLDRLETGK